MIRITLIVAIAAALAVIGFNLVTVRDKVTALQTDLAQTKSDLATTQANLARTRSDLNKTQADLKQTQQNLETTTAEKNKALKDAETQTKRANQLAADLQKTKKDLGDAQASLEAYRLTNLTPDQILKLSGALKETQEHLAAVQEENTLLDRKVKKVQAELSVYKIPNPPILLPANLQGKIVVSDPKWNFVVLNIGEEQGVLPHGQLLVNRDGRLVAKVVVTSVQKDRCIANVMPGWKLGDLMEGDQVIPAYPAS